MAFPKGWCAGQIRRIVGTGTGRALHVDGDSDDFTESGPAQQPPNGASRVCKGLQTLAPVADLLKLIDPDASRGRLFSGAMH